MLSSLRSFVLGIAFLGAACASDARQSDAVAAPAQRAQVVVHQVRTATHFELVSGTDEERVEQYSTKSSSALRKVASAEVMGEVLARVDSYGFDQLAVGGPAPTEPGPDVVYTLEVTRDGRSRYVVASRDMQSDQREQVMAMVRDVITAWNLVYSLQSVEPRPAEDIFGQPGARPR